MAEPLPGDLFVTITWEATRIYQARLRLADLLESADMQPVADVADIDRSALDSFLADKEEPDNYRDCGDRQVTNIGVED